MSTTDLSTARVSASDSGELVTALDAVPLIAILRSRRGDHLDACIDTLVDAGVRALEVTLPTPTALEAVRRACERYAGHRVAVGVGTVLDRAGVVAASGAGASFVVSPDTDPDVVAAARAAGLATLPGAMTPSEVRAAVRAGSELVKLFPARSLGPAYVADLLAPLPGLQLVPVGGVDAATGPAYLAAGARAVGVGSPLLGTSLETGQLADLARRATDLVAAVTTR